MAHRAIPDIISDKVYPRKCENDSARISDTSS